MTYSNDTKFQDNIWTTATSGPSGPTIAKPGANLFTNGFSYGVSGTPPEAPNQNWLQNRSDSFCELIEKYGSISYLTGVDYDVGATVYNDNNGTVSVYKCNIPNGPSSATVNPVGDVSGTWTRVNQWGSKGYTPNTVIVSDASGNIQSSNLYLTKYDENIAYEYGQKVWVWGIGANGELERQIWVNVYLNPNDPTDETFKNLYNASLQNSPEIIKNSSPYDWFNIYWRRERTSISLQSPIKLDNGTPTGDTFFLEGYVLASGLIEEISYQLTTNNTTGVYVSFADMITTGSDGKPSGFTPDLINGTDVRSTTSVINSGSSIPRRISTTPAGSQMNTYSTIYPLDGLKFLGFFSTTSTPLLGTGKIGSFYWTDKIRNV